MTVNVIATKRFYTMNSLCDFEEDNTHEFKAHINIAIEEIPRWAYDNSGGQSRAAISKAICAFLNSERGGTIYCGILDDGQIQGLSKTQYQLDHMKLSLEDVLARYTPPVAPGRVSICHVPVVDKGCTPENVQHIVSSRQAVDQERRRKPHELREKSFQCWCVKDAKAQLANNPEQQLYVVEMMIAPWDRARGAEWGGIGEMKMLPILQDECGRAYARCQATVLPYSPTEVHMLAEQNVKQYYEPQIAELKKKLYALRLAKKHKTEANSSNSSIGNSSSNSIGNSSSNSMGNSSSGGNCSTSQAEDA